MLKIHETGAGAPLLLVHGSPGDGRAWGRVLKALPGGFRAVAPDLPGHGGSESVPGDSPDRIGAMTERLATVLDGIEGPVALAGHSFGGVVALHLASLRPERIAQLALFEPVFFRALELAGETGPLAAARAHFGAYLDAAGADTPDAIAAMIDYWFGDGSFARLPEPARGFLNSRTATNALDVRASLTDTLPGERLAAMRCPVTIATGGASPAITAEIATALVGLLPDARHRVIDGATHAMLDSHASAVAEILDS
ncbi:MAG: alpha/beta fold hydrolase [Pseudomonadota bacterium]|nr:alpha/beta fold hydrolase [Pseudomonadota bacterium]